MKMYDKHGLPTLSYAFIFVAGYLVAIVAGSFILQLVWPA